MTFPITLYLYDTSYRRSINCPSMILFLPSCAVDCAVCFVCPLTLRLVNTLQDYGNISCSFLYLTSELFHAQGALFNLESCNMNIRKDFRFIWSSMWITNFLLHIYILEYFSNSP